MLSFAIEQHEIIVAGAVLLAVFTLNKLFGTYIEEWVKFRYKQSHSETCSCPAMDMVKEDIPEIRAIQKERTKQISDITTCLANLTTSFGRQEKNIDKLFTLFEEEWKATIRELKGMRDGG